MVKTPNWFVLSSASIATPISVFSSSSHQALLGPYRLSLSPLSEMILNEQEILFQPHPSPYPYPSILHLLMNTRISLLQSSGGETGLERGISQIHSFNT